MHVDDRSVFLLTHLACSTCDSGEQPQIRSGHDVSGAEAETHAIGRRAQPEGRPASAIAQPEPTNRRTPETVAREFEAFSKRRANRVDGPGTFHTTAKSVPYSGDGPSYEITTPKRYRRSGTSRLRTAAGVGSGIGGAGSKNFESVSMDGAALPIAARAVIVGLNHEGTMIRRHTPRGPCRPCDDEAARRCGCAVRLDGPSGGGLRSGRGNVARASRASAPGSDNRTGTRMGRRKINPGDQSGESVMGPSLGGRSQQLADIRMLHNLASNRRSKPAALTR